VERLDQLMTPVAPLLATSSGAQARERFAAEPRLRLLPVVDGDRLVGGLERARFLAALSQQLGTEVYGRRPVTLLMGPAPDRMDAATPVSQAATLLSGLSGDALPVGIVVTDAQGRVCGVVDIADLMSALIRQHARQTRDLEEAREAAQAAADAKGSFLASMSHELRTPLNGVLGMAQALTATPLDARQRQLVATIEDSGDVLMRLLNDLLDLSRIDAGRLDLVPQPCCLATLLRTACALFEQRAADNGLGFGLSIDLPPGVRHQVDPARFKQIVYNLLSNAIKFTSAGRVDVALRATDGGIEMCVADTGIGMAPDAVERLFQPFVQADSSITRRYGGSGLGLSICKRLADLMGGTIAASSAPGEGTRLTVRLPLETCLQPLPDPEAAYTEQPCLAADGPVLRVLAAEDNATNRAVLAAILADFPVELVFAHNGAEAVSLFEQARFDLVLMDLQMPVLGGLDATRQIRELEARQGLPRTPVLAVSANAMPEHVAEALAAGLDGHVAKPIRLDLLIEAMDAALEAPDSCQVAAVA
jgi:signal transduction histidine kinase/ActR/RegA family two-component response regulator